MGSRWKVAVGILAIAVIASVAWAVCRRSIDLSIPHVETETVLLLVTVVYVAFTGLLYWVTAQMRSDATRPNIVIAAVPNSNSDPNFLDIVLRNTGNGEARNIRMSLETDFLRDEEAEEGRGRMLSELGYFGEGISYLGPHDERRFFFTSLHEDGDRKLESAFEITLRYEDASGKVFGPVAVPINLREFKNVSVLGRNTAQRDRDAMPRDIKELSKQVRRIATALEVEGRA